MQLLPLSTKNKSYFLYAPCREKAPSSPRPQLILFINIHIEIITLAERTFFKKDT